MNPTVDIGELEIVLAAKSHNPTILNPDFLKYNRIVPDDWELARPPICIEPVAQVTFQNGVNILAQSEAVTFSQIVKTDRPDTIKVPGIARKYVETIKSANYLAVGINAKGHVVFSDRDAAHKYLLERLLYPGDWCDFGEDTVKAAIKFVYKINGSQLNLIIDEAELHISDNTNISVLFFAANFHRDLAGNSQEERVEEICAIVDNWKADIETYREIVNQRFLKPARG